MKTVCIECRKLEEWDKETQEKIIEKHRDFNVQDEWWDCETDFWAEKLAEMGFDIVETEWKTNKKGVRYESKSNLISFSGFYSQGDGASFTGTVDIQKWIETQEPVKYARILKLLNSGKIQHSAKIKRDRWHHYVHWNTTSIYHDWYMNGDHSRIEALIEELEEDVLKHHQDLNREIYRDLEKDYDGQCTDEAVRESLIANEYEFDNTGKIM